MGKLKKKIKKIKKCFDNFNKIIYYVGITMTQNETVAYHRICRQTVSAVACQGRQKTGENRCYGFITTTISNGKKVNFLNGGMFSYEKIKREIK